MCLYDFLVVRSISRASSTQGYPASEVLLTALSTRTGVADAMGGMRDFEQVVVSRSG